MHRPSHGKKIKAFFLNFWHFMFYEKVTGIKISITKAFRIAFKLILLQRGADSQTARLLTYFKRPGCSELWLFAFEFWAVLACSWFPKCFTRFTVLFEHAISSRQWLALNEEASLWMVSEVIEWREIQRYRLIKCSAGHMNEYKLAQDRLCLNRSESWEWGYHCQFLQV